ncbi:alpha/beta fold hydrolase [Hazenella sp. IB182357]|uniref:Alpha/beta fold hydrolase n=1 Tax=Polycladospora coralii TaxID=2771432 RepID=A0A926RT77_9BACL|nr:alpha/beta fold hydrolase [Polycladospora coralii]MBD1370799.1 alpha/beta fold hydrolase [Polycladospora coralii]
MKKAFEIKYSGQDRTIRGDVHIPTEAEHVPVLVLCHGFKGFKDWGFFPSLADQLKLAGFAVITFNFSMNGVGADLEHFTELDKFSMLTFSSEQEDLHRVLQALKNSEIPFTSHMNLNAIGLMGHSRGGGNSLIYTLNHPTMIQAVTVWNSISQAKFFSNALIEELNRNGEAYIENARTNQKMPMKKEIIEDIEKNQDAFSILARVHQFPCPLQFIQADQDVLQLREGVSQLHQKCPSSILHWIEETGHTFGATHPFKEITKPLAEAIHETINFFQSHLTPSS